MRKLCLVLSLCLSSLIYAQDVFELDDGSSIISKVVERNDGVLYKAEIEYSTISARNIPLQCFDSSFGNIFHDAFSGWVFLEIGLYGNSISLYLIERFVYKSSDEEVEMVFEYLLNKNEYVVEMVDMDCRASGTFTTTYTFDREAYPYSSIPTGCSQT